MFAYHRPTIAVALLAAGCTSNRPTEPKRPSTLPALVKCNNALSVDDPNWRNVCADVWAEDLCTKAWKENDATRQSIITTCAATYCPLLTEYHLDLCANAYDDSVWEPNFYAFSQVALARDLRLAASNPATGKLGVNLIKHLDNQTNPATTIRLRVGEFSIDGGKWQDNRTNDVTPALCESDIARVNIFLEPNVPDYEAGYYISTLRSCGKEIHLGGGK